MLLKPIPVGRYQKIYKVYAICDDRDKCQAEEFFTGLDTNYEKDIEKIHADIRKACGSQNGAKALPPGRCHDVDKGNGIFEFTGGTQTLRLG